ncbi:MAG: M4 family metallopeptidase [Clostridiales bacterium]|nr:M4 family metallopeptidase [Clostridiales bacterium]
MRKCIYDVRSCGKDRRRRTLSIFLVISMLVAVMSLPACKKSDAEAQKKSSEDYERHKMETKDPDDTSETRETTEPSQRDTSVRQAPTLSPTPTPIVNSQGIVQLTAQDIQDMNGGNAIIVYGDEGYVSTIVGRFFDRPVDDEEDAINALKGLQSLLGIETGYFPFSVYGSTYRGYTIYTYQQLKGDMVVYNASLKIVLDREGYPWMLQSSLSTNLDYEVSDPKINASEAESIILSAWGNGLNVLSEYTMETCLVDYYHMSQHCFQVITNNPYQNSSFDMPYFIHFVDYDGNYVRCYPTADLPDDRFADYGNESYFKDLVATDCTFTINRNGEDVTFTVPISYNTVDQKYYLADPERKIIVGDYYEFKFNRRNLLFTCQEENENWPEHDLFAYYNFIRVYDFFKEFNIESTDGFGMPILILMGYCESDKTPIDNLANGGIEAGWSIMCVTRASDKCFSMDVCGHEFTHGISTFSRQGCVYQDEYGTVNEAFSEILGNISEMYVGDTTDTTWLLEETCGMPVICMSQPDLYYQPNMVGDEYYTPNSYASLNTDYMDWGGVHRNDSLITNLCCVLEQQGWTLEELANFFICAIEMHTTLADFDDMYAVFIAAAYVCDKEEFIPVIEQYWQDKKLVGNRQKTNETTTIDGYAKMLIHFSSEDLAAHAMATAYSTRDKTMVAWAPVQYDGVAVLRIPEGLSVYIIVCEFSDDYFEDVKQYKYLNNKQSDWTLDSYDVGVVKTVAGTITTLPDYS